MNFSSTQSGVRQRDPQTFERIKPMTQQTKTMAVDKAVQNALASERKRTAEIKDLGDKFGLATEAKRFVDDGKSTAEFHKHILAKSPAELKASIEDPDRSVQGSSNPEAVARIKARRANR